LPIRHTTVPFSGADVEKPRSAEATANTASPSPPAGSATTERCLPNDDSKDTGKTSFSPLQLEKRTATALLSHFSTYVVADVSESVSKEPTGPCSSEILPSDTVDNQTTDTVTNDTAATDSQTADGTVTLPETNDETPASMLPALGVIAVAVIIAGVAVAVALRKRKK
jgi:LPXTG-motif cell wall-anchored protein